MTSILFERRGALGLITLNRPEALNAMDAAMAIAMREQLLRWADDPAVEAVAVRGAGNAFCAGGDIRAVWKMGREAVRFFDPEYNLVQTIRVYPKPYIALMDGVTMGGGVGISLYASHRIATPNTLWAMPECGIGFYPDIGATWFLPRLAREMGTYLALAGARLKAADLLALGIATGVAESGDSFLSLLTSSSAKAEDLLQDKPQGDPPLSRRMTGEKREAIDRCFAFDTVEEIIAALHGEPGEWAREAVARMAANSPTSLKVTLRQMRLGAALSFDQAMALERRLTRRFLEGPDFYEGVRAALIDRDRSPRWQPGTLAEVDRALVDSFFS